MASTGRGTRGEEDGNIQENNPLGLVVNNSKDPSLIQPVELEALRLVFNHFLKNGSDSKGVTAASVAPVLSRLGMPMNKRDIELMIWEVDEDNDGVVKWEEFLVMYQRNIIDNKTGSGLEPKQLYHLTLFLMFENDANRDGTISIEQTLNILYVRNPNQGEMDREINEIFGEERERAAAQREGYEVRINYATFLNQVNKITNAKRNRKKEVSVPKK